MIKKVLIANRGEIAIRIAKSCKKLGIKTVGVYSKDDSASLHLTYCDENYLLGDDPLKGSYLNIEKLIEISKKLSVDAIHPGYGFLSENSGFVKKLNKEKIIFIGPSYKAIELMGDKIESKKIAKKAGVNCIPGYEHAIKNVREGLNEAKKIGYPVMIKASAGGGGKGMRIAKDKNEFEELLTAAKNEALNAFGDDRVFIEKYIEKPRHIEMQILADNHGNIIWLGERECSIQRRHQKIIEEAPSSFIDNVTRVKMGEQAISLAKEVNYSSAGTVEFVVDQKQNFYFLEMNTRLQVEHPVTELVTGIDLVEEMIHVANNKKLKIKQNDIKVQGWAFESRLCAESPKKNFLPSAGRLVNINYPVGDIRVDNGYQSGGEVSIYYDSLLAKIISKGKDRNDALSKMQIALSDVAVEGIETNIDFLMDIYKKEAFAKGEINTNFIAETYDNGYEGKIDNKKEQESIILLAISYHINYLYSVNTDIKNISKNWVVSWQYDEYEININSIKDNFISIMLNNSLKEFSYQIDYINKIIQVYINEKKIKGRVNNQENLLKVFFNGTETNLNIFRKNTYKLYKILPKENINNKLKNVLSPMPGKVTKVLVKEKDKVQEGDSLLILDAMKMENIIKSDFNGTIKKISVKENQSVSADEMLITFD
ncbi:MAG: acetyl/propionyl-CoA carboxylase subunit alpha [Alphaproteobacteria bacterium]|nr:MAG: acetyl/propionyl-CoA carboxylase subunit alpha [Alphaproteobacteria bacterium]